MTRAVSVLPLPLVEEWRPIPGHEGRYSASTAGRIRSEPRTEHTPYYPNGRTYKGTVLRTWVNEFGYECVRLTLPAGLGKPHSKVHRLVCAAFHGGAPSPKHEPNHINHTRTDNRPCNLEWMTRAQNIQYAYDSGRRNTAYARGESAGGAKLTVDQVREIRTRYNARPKESRHQIAADYNIELSNVWMIGTRKSWKHVYDLEEGL